MIAVSLFDYTGTMLKPWHEAGYECHIFDIQHPKGMHRVSDGMYTHGVDLRTTEQVQLALEYILTESHQQVAFLSCFPPCTHLSISGARWFKGKGLRALEESIGYFATCVEVAEALDCPYIIENPVSTISTYWREADHKFHPCHYSGYNEFSDNQENYTKETWLWTSQDFVMPPRRMVGDLFDMPDTTYIHHQSPGEERANIRSATPMGFAKAVYLANS